MSKPEKNADTSGVVLTDLLDCVPSNWCDPLLTGPRAVWPADAPYSNNDLVGVLNAVRDRLESRVVAKQARIDRLMLEYCPEEMSAEQLAAYEVAQKQSNG